MMRRVCLSKCVVMLHECSWTKAATFAQAHMQFPLRRVSNLQHVHHRHHNAAMTVASPCGCWALPQHPCWWDARPSTLPSPGVCHFSLTGRAASLRSAAATSTQKGYDRVATAACPFCTAAVPKAKHPAIRVQALGGESPPDTAQDGAVCRLQPNLHAVSPPQLTRGCSSTSCKCSFARHAHRGDAGRLALVLAEEAAEAAAPPGRGGLWRRRRSWR